MDYQTQLKEIRFSMWALLVSQILLAIVGLKILIFGPYILGNVLFVIIAAVAIVIEHFIKMFYRQKIVRIQEREVGIYFDRFKSLKPGSFTDISQLGDEEQDMLMNKLKISYQDEDYQIRPLSPGRICIAKPSRTPEHRAGSEEMI